MISIKKGLPMKKHLLLVLKIICGVLVLLWLVDNFITNSNRKKQQSVSQQYLLEQTCVNDCVNGFKDKKYNDITKKFNFNQEDIENYCKCACQESIKNGKNPDDSSETCVNKYLHPGRVTDEFDKCVRLGTSKYNEDIFWGSFAKQQNMTVEQVKQALYPMDFKLYVSCICEHKSADVCGKLVGAQALLDATFEQCIKVNKEQLKISFEQIKSRNPQKETDLLQSKEQDIKNYCKCFINKQQNIKKETLSVIEKADKLKVAEKGCVDLYF